MEYGRKYLDHRQSTLVRGSRCHYVTANGVRNGLERIATSRETMRENESIITDWKRMAFTMYAYKQERTIWEGCTYIDYGGIWGYSNAFDSLYVGNS